MLPVDRIIADTISFLADPPVGFGRAVVLGRKGNGPYDVATGIAEEDEIVECTGRARLGDYKDRDINGTTVLNTDRRVTFRPDDLSIVPQVGDLLGVPDLSQTVYTIIDFKTREIGGTVICYTLQVR